MANFPDAAPSFASKSAGQTIEASHVNSLQEEVVAIGAGYVNGTARLNSSNSTLAHISAGTSTFSGLTATNSTLTNLQATNSTIGTLTATTIVPGQISAASTHLAIASIATATSGTSGGASALPSTPSGYIKVLLNGSSFVIPYFNA